MSSLDKAKVIVGLTCTTVGIVISATWSYSSLKASVAGDRGILMTTSAKLDKHIVGSEMRHKNDPLILYQLKKMEEAIVRMEARQEKNTELILGSIRGNHGQ